MNQKTLLQYIKDHERDIYVRAEVNGRWGSFNLTEVNNVVWADYLDRFLTEYDQEGAFPVRVIHN